MEALLNLIGDYGLWIYMILFAYCALKSGSLPLFAGYAAQAEALQLAPVAAVTFAGGYLGDEFRFWIARRYGAVSSNKWPQLRSALHSAQAMVDRYGWQYIFLYRYPKGMRTIGALPIGLGSMPWSSFSFLNAASASLWTFVLVGAGFAFGAQIERAVQTEWGFVSTLLLALMVLGICVGWWRINRLKQRESATN